MKKVTFMSTYKKKNKTIKNEIVEYTEATESMIKLRALALNWSLISIEYL